MAIEKNEKTYSVRENMKSWTVSIKLNSLSVTYNVSKSDCSTFDELKAYVAQIICFKEA